MRISKGRNLNSRVAYGNSQLSHTPPAGLCKGTQVMARFHYIDKEDLSKDPFGAEEEIPKGSEFETLLSEDTAVVRNKKFRPGESVTGTVISVGETYIFVDLGGKNAGALPKEELTAMGTLFPKVGDEVTAFVKSDNGSEVVLSKQLRRGESDDSALRLAYENGVPIEGKVDKVVKGGFEVSLSGKRAFVPQSQMDFATIENPEVFVGTVQRFLITEFKPRNIVLSRKALIKEERQEQVQELLRTLQVGQSVAGTVTKFLTFGAFVDIGGIEALVPLSELGWKRVKNAEEVLKLGEKITAKVLRIEHTPKLKIALSLKDAGEDPWLSHATRLVPGSAVPGVVTRLSDFGAFVQVFEGVEGLAHVSQLTWEKRVGHPREVVTGGQEVNVHILSVDLEARKLSLSIKGPMPEELAKKLASKTKGDSEMTDAERTDMAEWKSFQDLQKKAAHDSGSANAFAAAFAIAKKKRS